jgi:hypothetical protein
MNVLYFAGIGSALGPLTVLATLSRLSVCSGHRLKCIGPVTPHHVFFSPSHHRVARLQVVEGGNGFYMWNVVSNLLSKKALADNRLHRVVIWFGQMGGADQHPPYNDIEL